MNDLIRFTIDRAVKDHGSQVGEFTARRFWIAFAHLADVPPVWDDNAVRIVAAMLSGRPDVELLADGKYRRLP